MKRHTALFFLVKIALLFSSFTLANEEIKKSIEPHWKLTDTQLLYLKEGKILTSALVESIKKNNNDFQSFLFKTAALNNKNCERVLDLLSHYENFKFHLDFIKQSNYNDLTNYVSFLIDSPLLPFPMTLSFKIPRIKKPGQYLFEFENGFLKGLKGIIHVHSVSNQCLIYAESNWTGEDTKIPNFVMEIFSETLTRIAFEKLFRAVH